MIVVSWVIKSSVNRWVSRLASDKNDAFIFIWMVKDGGYYYNPAKLVHVSACVNIDQCIFLQGKMQFFISWILLVSSASLLSAELPSINDDEGN